MALSAAVLSLIGCAAEAPKKNVAYLPAAEQLQPSLPVRKVHLYEIGVGYFERAGKLAPGSDYLTLPASHVDDALKTLIILSDGAPLMVSAVEFDSVLSEALARVQAGLPTDKKQLTYPTLLDSLRGAKIELALRGGRHAEGRLVEVTEVQAERVKKKPADDESNDEKAEAVGLSPATTNPNAPAGPRYIVTIVTANGALSRFDSATLESIRPLESAVAKRLDSVVEAASARGAMAARSLKIAATKNVPIRLGYVTEAPAWRVSYRLILGKSEAETMIQGWVLVHNDTDEPWRNVDLEIINGKPDSFLYPITAPRYLRRPLNAPVEEMSTLPQLASKTPDQIWGDREERDNLSGDEIGDAVGAGGLGLSGIGEGGGGRGEGIGYGSASNHITESTEILPGNLGAIDNATAVASGANFRYRIGHPIDLNAHSTALVPFTSLTVKAELLTRFEWMSNEGRVSTQLSNNSGQTLPGGPISIFSTDGLAGEANLQRLPSGKSTWLNYGTDLDTDVQTTLGVTTQTTKLVRYFADNLEEHFVRHQEAALLITNRSTLKRQVCLGLPVGRNANVTGADRLKIDEERTQPLAVFDVDGRTEQRRTLIMDDPQRKSAALSELTDSKLTALANSKELDARTRSILLEAAAFLSKNSPPSRKLAQQRQRSQQLDAEIQRCEGLIEKLKGSGNATAPIAKRLIELEASRSRLAAEQSGVQEAMAAKGSELAKILDKLNAKP